MLGILNLPVISGSCFNTFFVSLFLKNRESRNRDKISTETTHLEYHEWWFWSRAGFKKRGVLHIWVKMGVSELCVARSPVMSSLLFWVQNPVWSSEAALVNKHTPHQCLTLAFQHWHSTPPTELEDGMLPRGILLIQAEDKKFWLCRHSLWL